MINININKYSKLDNIDTFFDSDEAAAMNELSNLQYLTYL